MEKNNLSEYENKIVQVDGIIDKIWILLKKHWYKLLIFLIIYGGYKFFVLVGEEIENPTKVETIDSPTEPLFVVREYQEEQEDGSVKTVQVWNDSIETYKSK